MMQNDAARVWWILKNYGHESTALLDGGFKIWSANNKIETISIPITSKKYHFPQDAINPNKYKVTRQQILNRLGNDKNTVILDVRTKEEYSGKKQVKGAFSAGRIEGSMHLEWKEFVNFNSDHTFKTKYELAKIFRNKGISPEKNIITYCQSGVRSAHTLFVLTQILGYPKVQNYDSSWVEWSYYKKFQNELDEAFNKWGSINPNGFFNLYQNQVEVNPSTASNVKQSSSFVCKKFQR